MTFESSTFTRAPITPSDVNLRYSKLRPLETVFKNGYKNSGICAFKKSCLVSLCDATHCKSASTLQALLEIRWSRSGGLSSGYTLTISYRRAAIVPTECQMNGASSEKCSRYYDNVLSAWSLLSAYLSSSIYLMISSLVSSLTEELFKNDCWFILLCL